MEAHRRLFGHSLNQRCPAQARESPWVALIPILAGPQRCPPREDSLAIITYLGFLPFGRWQAKFLEQPLTKFTKPFEGKDKKATRFNHALRIDHAQRI